MAPRGGRPRCFVESGESSSSSSSSSSDSSASSSSSGPPAFAVRLRAAKLEAAFAGPAASLDATRRALAELAVVLRGSRSASRDRAVHKLFASLAASAAQCQASSDCTAGLVKDVVKAATLVLPKTDAKEVARLAKQHACASKREGRAGKGDALEEERLGLADLGADVVVRVASFLPADALARLAAACRMGRDAVGGGSEGAYERLFREHFGGGEALEAGSSSWRESFNAQANARRLVPSPRVLCARCGLGWAGTPSACALPNHRRCRRRVDATTAARFILRGRANESSDSEADDVCGPGGATSARSPDAGLRPSGNALRFWDVALPP